MQALFVMVVLIDLNQRILQQVIFALLAHIVQLQVLHIAQQAKLVFFKVPMIFPHAKLVKKDFIVLVVIQEQ